VSDKEHVILVGALRWITPLTYIFALALLRNWPPDVGVGFAAGVVFVLPLVLCSLLFGVLSVFEALPPTALRLTLVLGVAVALVGATIPGFEWNKQISEAGVLVATSAGLLLALLVLMARAPALSDVHLR
jgi:multisubunit Na+/H+ antiporter MnhB subunit